MATKILAVALAIAHCRPSLPKVDVDAYAAIVEKRAVAIGVDPILIVGLVAHESGWIHGAVNKKSGALGFGQILPQFRPACAKEPASAVCSAEKKRLLDGAYNLSAVFDSVEAWQRECKKRTGKAGTIEWLMSYSGLNRPKASEWCGWRLATGVAPVRLPTHSLVREILDKQVLLRKWLASHPQG